MSAEAPVLVVRELQKKNFIGGAAIVASHIKSLGAKCNFLSVVGMDDTAQIIKKEQIYIIYLVQQIQFFGGKQTL